MNVESMLSFLWLFRVLDPKVRLLLINKYNNLPKNLMIAATTYTFSWENIYTYMLSMQYPLTKQIS